MSPKNEINMTEGRIMPKILQFTIPLILSGLLQLAFNAADNVVVGQFAGSDALAAVSSTGSITNFVINLFIGLSVGTNMILSNAIGAGNKRTCDETVHTSITLGVVLGVLVGTFAILLCPWILELLNVPERIKPLTAKYLNIYFLGAPAILVYNYGSAIMRSTGDTKRPMYYLIFAGVVNVTLNLILVIGFNLDTAGVAIATTISQYISALLILYAIRKNDGMCKFNFRRMRIVPGKVWLLVKYGIPASIQSLMFSVSNISIQTCVNGFGPDAMAGCGSASTVESFVYIITNSVSQAALAFCGQNFGAHKIQRVRKVITRCIIFTSLLTIINMSYSIFLSKPLLGIFIPDNPEAMSYGIQKLSVTAYSYILCALMEVFTGTLRGLGKSLMPAVISIVGICGLRLLWIATVFEKIPTLLCLYTTYPVTWGVTAVIQGICLWIVYRKIKKVSLTQEV